MGRLALLGKKSEAASLMRRDLRLLTEIRPELGQRLESVLADASSGRVSRSYPVAPVPADLESRLELVREDDVVFRKDPIWPSAVSAALGGLLAERLALGKLIDRRIDPTRTVLFIGPPGVGKTLAARWLAHKLGQPLLILDLASVMSSFLGRTGNNIRSVVDYAQSRRQGVLLIDELDAVAKRRGDETEIGELKRLVTVLIQCLDNWETGGLLVAATNHPDLLDTAIWRRFDRIIEFPLPTATDMVETIQELMGSEWDAIRDMVPALVIAAEGWSYSDLTRWVNNARRDSVIQGKDIHEIMEAQMQASVEKLTKAQRLRVAKQMVIAGLSQRRASDLTGVSRDTLRRHTAGGPRMEANSNGEGE